MTFTKIIDFQYNEINEKIVLMFHPTQTDLSIYDWDLWYKDKIITIYKSLNENDNLFITLDGNKLYNEGKRKGLIDYTIYTICCLSIELSEKLMVKYNIPSEEKYDLIECIIQTINIPFMEVFGEFSMEVWQLFKIWKKNNS